MPQIAAIGPYKRWICCSILLRGLISLPRESLSARSVHPIQPTILGPHGVGKPLASPLPCACWHLILRDTLGTLPDALERNARMVDEVRARLALAVRGASRKAVWVRQVREVCETGAARQERGVALDLVEVRLSGVEHVRDGGLIA